MILFTFVLQLENTNMSIFQVFQKHVFALCDGTNQKYFVCTHISHLQVTQYHWYHDVKKQKQKKNWIYATQMKFER